MTVGASVAASLFHGAAIWGSVISSKFGMLREYRDSVTIEFVVVGVDLLLHMALWNRFIGPDCGPCLAYLTFTCLRCSGSNGLDSYAGPIPNTRCCISANLH